MKKRLDHIRRNRIISSLLPFGGLILIFLLFLILTRGRILKPTNISNIIDQVFTTLIVSVGAVFVYAHGGFDMSVSAICGVAQLAMAALVTATDAKIRQAFATEIPDTTKIIIAQRISSVQNADRIIVMDDGKINGIGTHEELLAQNEIYREVYESQTGGSGDFDEKGGDQ